MVPLAVEQAAVADHDLRRAVVFKATVSPVAKLSVPLSVSVCVHSPIATLAPAPTVNVPPDCTVTFWPKLEATAPQ